MNLVPLCDAATRGELILVDGGFCHFHRRRDGVVTIRELLVLPSSRKQGIGKWLVERVAQNNPGATLRARCPASWEANAFWQAMGFVLAEDGAVKVWERSSTAPAATLVSLGRR